MSRAAPAEAAAHPAHPRASRSPPGRIAHLGGWRRGLAAFLAGCVSALAMPPLSLWPVLFATLPVLVWLLDGCYAAPLRVRLRRAAVTGWWFGFGYFIVGLYWIAEAFLVEAARHAWLLPFATILPAGLALFFALAASLAMLLWRPGVSRIFALAFALGLTEWARGHVLTGFPWNLLGHALTTTDAMMQVASLVGANALTVFAVMLFASPAGLIMPAAARRPLLSGAILVAVALLLLGGASFFGERRLAQAQARMTDGVRFRIVQANISQKDKWAPENAAEILDTYLSLSRGKSPTAAAGGGVTHIIWPETSLPVLLADEPEVRTAIADLLAPGMILIAGSARLEQDAGPDGNIRAERVYNSLFVLNDAATIVGSYDKMHLVPFGEYLPAQDFMESMGVFQLTGVRGGFTPGEGPKVLLVPGTPPAAPLICYEIIFPGEVTDPTVRPGWLLNLTNDAWFGASAGPYQHFHQARLRAVEQGLPVVRAANTGISAIIDPYGRVVTALGMDEAGVVEAGLPEALPPPFYARYGAAAEEASLALAALLCFLTGGPARRGLRLRQ